MMKNSQIHIIAVIIILFFSYINAIAQDKKKKTVKVRVEYFKDYDQNERIVATVRIKEKRYVAFADAPLNFYNVNDTGRVLIDKIKTNKKGIAILGGLNSYDLYTDSAGIISFEIEYIGDANTKKTEKGVEFKRVNMEISFFQKDTIKYIEIDAEEIEFANKTKPLKNAEIQLSIKGTFSNLEFISLESDENGKVIAEFPIDMPGDTSGVLTIVAKINEDDVFGTVESRGKINWGKHLILSKEKQRGLGDTDAPLWMVYTLIILLSAVWFNYLYVILIIFKIKRARKLLELPEI